MTDKEEQIKIPKKRRKDISKRIQREIYREAAGRCAVPACRESTTLEIAHIIPVSNKGDNDFYNLILLCANCHGKFDAKKNMGDEIKGYDREHMLNLKKNLLYLNNKYCSFELRLRNIF